MGGGPAPGINSVIEAATIRSRLCGVDIVGIEEGFKWLMKGDLSHTRPLTRQTVSHVHFRGGSLLGTSRANPTKHPQDLSTVFDSLQKLNITGLITIGGDDTAFTAFKLNELAKGRLKVVHVPKTIDNDLCLPHGIPTFGFHTARHMGVEVVKNLLIDAHTTSRWYIVVTMGRKAGHLALGIGKAVGATLTLIPEEFKGSTLRLSQLTNIIVGSIVKRQVQHRMDGVAVLAEGLTECLDPEGLSQLGGIERDEHGNIRLAELDLGKVLRETITQRLKDYGLKVTIVSKNIGYELRCADPTPFDMEYTRDLGYCAAQFLLDDGNGAMVAIVNGRFTPLPFDEMLDPATNRTRVRMVDIDSESYRIARAYMARLEPENFGDEETVSQYAKILNISPDQFRESFQDIP